MSFALGAKVIPLPPPPRLLARYRGFSFHEERFSWLRYEAEQLFQQHYREASADLSVPLDIDWTMFGRLEAVDMIACVVVRRAGAPIGYCVHIVYPHLHYTNHMVADVDVFFIDPAHRKGWLGIKLFQVAEQLLREKGVKEVWNRVKLHVKPGRGGRDVGTVFRFLGYKPTETIYRKRIS
jgi:GNAT superfamily N-acetyltransferase